MSGELVVKKSRIASVGLHIARLVYPTASHAYGDIFHLPNRWRTAARTTFPPAGCSRSQSSQGWRAFDGKTPQLAQLAGHFCPELRASAGVSVRCAGQTSVGWHGSSLRLRIHKCRHPLQHTLAFAERRRQRHDDTDMAHAGIVGFLGAAASLANAGGEIS